MIGVTDEQLDFLLTKIESKTQTGCSPKEKLVLTLLKLRQNRSDHFLEFVTGIPDSTLNRYIDEMMQALFQVIIVLSTFPVKEYHSLQLKLFEFLKTQST